MLENLITSKTRLRLLIKFFISQANHGYLNGLASEMGESTNSIRKELNNLYQAGYLKKYKVNNKVKYKANVDNPLFSILQKVILKHLGIEKIIEAVLERMGDVEKIILIGEYAKGIDSGSIEMLLIGNNLDMEYIGQIENKVENLIQRSLTISLSKRFSKKIPHIILFDEKK